VAPAAAPPPAWGVSRSQLGRLALEAAAVVPGVVGVDAGPHDSYLTADEPAGVLRGVSVIAQADGRYAVDLCLVAGIVPLIELADEVRRRVRARAALERLADQVGAVNVEFARVLSDEEILAEAAAAAAAEAEAAAADQPGIPTGAHPPGVEESPS
jgi:hypothetical protein